MLTPLRAVVPLLLAACTQPRYLGDPADLSEQADDLLDPTTVEEVTARCTADSVVVRVRTKGWASEANLWIYQQDEQGRTQYAAEYVIPSVGFTPPPEEACDIMSLEVPFAELADACADLTFAVTVRYEDLCAVRGCVVFGHTPGAVVSDLYDPPNEGQQTDRCHVDDFCRDDAELVARIVTDPVDDAEGCTGRE